MDIFQSIREQNLIDYGQRFEEWAPRILVDQYSDRTHFLFELLQNSEDAEASEISISLFPDRLELVHDGRPFTQEDIRGICGVNSSVKRNSRDRIGRFGIGFKSVYAYTDRPHIISGQYDFEIKNLIMPFSLENIGTFQATKIILPFDQEATQRVAFREIASSLDKNIVADCMLTLTHVKKISYKIEGPNTHKNRIINKTVRVLGKGVQDITLSEADADGMQIKTKLIAFLSSDSRPVMIAYKITDGTGTGRTLIPVNNTFLYAFFPTAIETHQSFYIHAPFDTTPARDNIKNNDYNSHLICVLAKLFEESVFWLRDRRYLTIKYFNQVYPIYKYSSDNLLSPLYTIGIEIIKNNNSILPTTTPGVYGTLQNTFIPESQNIIQCFDNSMLPALVGNPNAVWMDKAIASETSHEFKAYLQSCFDIKAIGWKALTINLSSALLETKTDDWLIALMRNIQPYCFSERGEDRIDARKLPLVRLQNGKHCLAKGVDGKPQVYINNPGTCPRKIKESIIQDFFAKNFYSRVLEIPVYDVFEEIATDIIPLYNNPRETVSSELNIKHIKLIVNALQENERRTVELVRSAPILLSSNGWTAPKVTYIPDAFFRSHSNEYALLEELPVAWLSETYKGKISTDIFLKIGCHASPEICDVDEKHYLDLLIEYDNDLANKYVTLYSSKTYHSARDGYNHRRMIAYLETGIKQLSLQASLALAEYISNNLTTLKLKGTILAANDAAFRGRSTISIDDVPSAIGMIVCQSEWVYCHDGITKRSVSQLKRSEIHPDYERRAAILLDYLPFIHEDNLVQELLGHYDPRYQAFLSELLQNQDSLKEAYASYASKKEQKEKKSDTRSVLPDDNIKNDDSFDNDRIITESATSEEEDDPLVEEVVRDIVKRTKKRKAASASRERSVQPEDMESSSTEDDYIEEDGAFAIWNGQTGF